MNRHQVKGYFKYLRHSSYWRGHGIHSPFVFHLVRDVMNCSHPFYHFEAIEEYRRELLKSNEKIMVKDLGAGNRGSTLRSISNIASQSAVSRKYGRLLSRLVHHSKPNTILELGSSLGVGSLYLALTRPSAQFITLEGCPENAKIASAALKRFNHNNFQVAVGHFDETLPRLLDTIDTLDFAWIDGNHIKDATIKYFELCRTKSGNHTVLVFDDIHWSAGMTQAWEQIIANPQVTASIDLFRVGIVFFRKECKKQHYKIRW